MKYKTLRSIVRFIINLIADVELVDLEKLPQGNFILAVNHLGRLDTAILLYAVDREDIILPVAEKYKNHPLYGAIGRAVNAIWLNRFDADYAAFREILARMEKGGLMVIAPEGTRSKTEALQEAKMGVAFIAGRSGYPVHRADRHRGPRRDCKPEEIPPYENRCTRWGTFPHRHPARQATRASPAHRHRRDHVPHRGITARKVPRLLCQSSPPE
jgi:1-acyl-sn-glycerol-3-phosphate acyltransferase